jgi:uncharacterized protein (UPF0212 family)
MKNKFVNILLLIILFASSAQSQIVLTLKKSFIDSIKDKITLTLDYTLDKANDKNLDLYSNFHTGKNPPVNNSKKSKDLIIAGRNQYVGLTIVARVFNAKTDLNAVDIINQNKGSIINVTGVWRLWCDYLGNDEFFQGKVNEEPNDYNPPHVFELTPVLKINDKNLLGFNDEINVHRIFSAETAFDRFSSAKCNIKINDSMITLVTQGLGYDFIDFVLQLNDLPKIKKDGRIVFGNVYSKEGDLLYSNLRMIFIKDSEPEKTVSELAKGDKLRVLGIPRINLNEIDSRINNSDTNKDLLNENLPFEMIIISVLN